MEKGNFPRAHEEIGGHLPAPAALTLPQVRFAGEFLPLPLEKVAQSLVHHLPGPRYRFLRVQGYFPAKNTTNQRLFLNY